MVLVADVTALTITNIALGLAVVAPLAIIIGAGLREGWARHHKAS